MKNNVFTFPILALAFIALFFTSCKKDEPVIEEVETMAEKVVGTWNVTTLTVDGQSMMDWFQELDLEIGNGTSKTIDFKFIDLDGNPYKEEGTYTLSANETTFTIDMDGDIINYTLEMVDSELSLTGMDDDGYTWVYVATK